MAEKLREEREKRKLEEDALRKKMEKEAAEKRKQDRLKKLLMEKARRKEY